MGVVVEGMTQVRPRYVELEPEQSLPLGIGFDVVELKLDGQWGRLVVENGQWAIWSRHGQVKASGATTSRAQIELQGEFLFGSNWAHRKGLSGQFWAFDVTRYRGLNVGAWPLGDRRGLLWRVVQEHGWCLEGLPPVKVVKQHQVGRWPGLWENDVLARGFEGLVFKRLADPFGATWGRMKRVWSVDYVCMGCNEGGGRYTGVAASSLQGGLWIEGQLQHVANIGGMSDEMRYAVYAKPEQYVGRVFEAKGKGLFESGGLRHPNFVKWRKDKQPEDCIRPEVA
jgi:ATP-dependent DNA ligase